MIARRVLVAPDAFKGTYSAQTVADIIAAHISGRADVDVCPLADGGEGTVDAVTGVGDRIDVVNVAGCDGKTQTPVRLLWRAPDTVLFECADIVPFRGADHDPRGYTTRGVGEAMAIAAAKGARTIIVALGGTATVDMGIGALGALGVNFESNGPVDVAPAAATLRGAHVIGWADVQHAVSAAAGRAGVEAFFAQKGLTGSAASAHAKFCRQTAARMGSGAGERPGSGAAGGLGAALLALGAAVVPGALEVMVAANFSERLAAAGAVITGEGAFDATSNAGKVAGRVIAAAASASRNAALVVGRMDIPAPIPAVALNGRALEAAEVGAQVRTLAEFALREP